MEEENISRAEYMRQYRDENKKRISEKRKERYRTDEKYREYMKQRARKYYEEKHGKSAKKRVKKDNDATVDKYLIKIKGVEKRVYPLRGVVEKTTWSLSSLRNWIREGFIPITPLVVGKKIRVYTDEMVAVIKKTIRKHGWMKKREKHKIYAEIFTGWEASGVDMEI